MWAAAIALKKEVRKRHSIEESNGFNPRMASLHIHYEGDKGLDIKDVRVTHANDSAAKYAGTVRWEVWKVSDVTAVWLALPTPGAAIELYTEKYPYAIHAVELNGQTIDDFLKLEQPIKRLHENGDIRKASERYIMECILRYQTALRFYKRDQYLRDGTAQ